MKGSVRERTLERLGGQTFDLVVIGGGIVGARVAYEAALTGATVALLEARDFGAATSSASSKLIHGGLRYLQRYDFDLVREAHRERRALLDRVAPHLVRPLTFVVPVYRGGLRAPAVVGAGLLTYSALSGFRHSQNRLVGRRAARALVPDLKTDGMRVAGVYEDAQTNDSRLVLATVAAASGAGAVVLNHARVSGVETLGGRVHGVRIGDLLVRARAVVNAAGPWVDEVRRMEDPAAAPMARLSKGVHVVLDAPGPWRAAVTAMLEGGRASFAVPWEGMLLLGTTDTEYEGDPGSVAALPEDVDTVLCEASTAMPPHVLDRSRIRYAFAGLRVLPRTAGSTVSAPRDEVVRTGPAGMVSVAGGKLTTHRRIALRVLRHLDAFPAAGMSEAPLPGAGRLPARPAAVPPQTWEHLTRLYGDEAARVASLGAEPVHPDGPDVWGQVLEAADREWAATVGDVVRRRTTLQVRGLDSPDVRERIAATLSERGVLLSVDGR
jgi:glycerol-3-phosphate dehydrogenase